MEGGIVSEIVLQTAIFLIMVSLGTALVADDIRRLLAAPRRLAVGLLCQLVLLPAIGFVVSVGFRLDGALAVCVVLLAAAPGGITSDLVVHAADGDRALSVSLTALSTTIAWLTMPFLLGAALDLFAVDEQVLGFPVGEVVVQLTALTIVPVAIGMAIRRIVPTASDRVAAPSRIVTGAFLAALAVVLVVDGWPEIVESAPRVAPALVALNAAALAVGWFVARTAQIPEEQALTIAVETGVQDVTLAMTIAATVLGPEEMGVIPAVYGAWMFVTSTGLAIWVARRRGNAGRPAS